MSDFDQNAGSCNPFSENFNWVLFLSTPKMWGAENLEKAEILSNGWVTCACGQLCLSLPREEDGSPFDKNLYDLGIGFNANIIEMRNIVNGRGLQRLSEAARKALDTLYRIEKRTTDLLKVYPDQYLHVRECCGTQEWVMPISSRTKLDLEKLIRKWIKQELGDDVKLDGSAIPRIDAYYYARIMTDGDRPESLRCYDGGGFYTKTNE